jgi:CDP-2,3-bis-(O-geranylgeranyl)-sn-glycerol synthase
MRFQLVSEMVLLLVIANGAPFVAHRLFGKFLDQPLDCNKLFRDGRPLLGPGKTIRGIFSAMIATTALAPLAGLGPAQGAAFGLLAMLGDLVSSFIKRRLDIATSHSAPLLDQLPETLLPLLVMQQVLSATLVEIAAAAAIFMSINLAFSWLRDWSHRWLR